MRQIRLKLRRNRAVWLVLFDAGCWVIGFLLFGVLRYPSAAETPWAVLVAAGAASGLLQFAIGFPVRLHQGRARLASLEEMVLLSFVTSAVGLCVFAANLAEHWMAGTTPLGSTIFALVLAAVGRATFRRLKERSDESVVGDRARRVLLVGAGDAAVQLIDSMRRDTTQLWNPVGMVDDDPLKRHLRYRGVPVLGRTENLAEAVEETRAEAVIVAVPSAPPGAISRWNKSARGLGVEVKVLPPTGELLSSHVGIRDLRDIELTDLLGRRQIDTSLSEIAGYLTGKKVLVTGAGGSIGSELCRQISRFNPSELMMLDRDESSLHAVQLSISGRALLDSDDVILCDIRDIEALTQVFRERRPDVVFHAAALKHLPMLEQYPAEAVKSNVIGTRNVLEAAVQVGTKRVVNISTDKAANPASVLGYSKRIAERITATYALEKDRNFVSVRFGNVLGSRGSVLTAFAQQIAGGGPVTVTHPDVTRYFMTIEEACQLVVQAAAIGAPGEALVLEMGEPVGILDVARQLIDLSGQQIGIEITGLREGEKLHEELFGDDEPQNVRPKHAAVSHVPVPPIDNDMIEALPVRGDRREIVRELAGLCLMIPDGLEASADWSGEAEDDGTDRSSHDQGTTPA